MSVSSIAAELAVITLAIPIGSVAVSEPTAIEQLAVSAVAFPSASSQTQWIAPAICKLLPNLPGCEKHRPHK